EHLCHLCFVEWSFFAISNLYEIRLHLPLKLSTIRRDIESRGKIISTGPISAADRGKPCSHGAACLPWRVSRHGFPQPTHTECFSCQTPPCTGRLTTVNGAAGRRATWMGKAERPP